MFFLDAELNELNKEFKSGAKIVSLEAPRYCGKRTLAHKFFEDKNAHKIYLQTSFSPEDEYSCLTLGLQGSIKDLSGDPTAMLRQMVDYLSQTEKSILVMDGILKYGKTLRGTLLNTIQVLSNTFVIVLIDTDSKEDSDLDDFLQRSGCRRIVYTSRRVHELIVSNQNKILEAVQTDESPEKIVNAFSLCRNFADFNLIFNAVSTRSAEWTTASSLDEIAQQIIKTRITALPKELQYVLEKCSVIGEKFDSQLLDNPFNLTHVNESLNALEKFNEVSNQTNSDYKFNYEQTYKFILGNIPKKNKYLWNKYLGDYFFCESQKLVSYHKYFNCLYKSCLYYDSGDCNEEFLDISKSLLHFYYNQENYFNFIQLAERVVGKVTDKGYLAYLKLNIALALVNLGEFQKAIINLEELRNVRSEIFSYETYQNIEFLLAECYYNFSDEHQAHEILKKLSNAKLKDKRLLFNVHSLEASLLHNMNERAEALKHYQAAINISNRFLKTDKVAYYRLLKKCTMFYPNKESIPFIEKAMEYFKDEGMSIDYAKCLHNLASIYLETALFDLAERYFLQAQEIFAQQYSIHGAYAENNLGIVYALRDKDYTKAFEYFKKANSYFNIESFTIITSYVNMSACCRKLKDFDSSIKYLTLACVEIDKKQGILEVSQYFEIYKYLSFAQYYLDIGDTPKAKKMIDSLNIEKFSTYFKQLIIDCKCKIDKTTVKTYVQPTVNILTEFDRNNVYLAEFLFWE